MGETAQPSPVRVLKALPDLPELLATANFRELRFGEVRRIPFLGHLVNKDVKKGRVCETPARHYYNVKRHYDGLLERVISKQRRGSNETSGPFIGSSAGAHAASWMWRWWRETAAGGGCQAAGKSPPTAAGTTHRRPDGGDYSRFAQR